MVAVTISQLDRSCLQCFSQQHANMCLSSQMVVVSDDVHEYAVALKDTEEKIARCPARVSATAASAGHQGEF